MRIFLCVFWFDRRKGCSRQASVVSGGGKEEMWLLEKEWAIRCAAL